MCKKKDDQNIKKKKTRRNSQKGDRPVIPAHKDPREPVRTSVKKIQTRNQKNKKEEREIVEDNGRLKERERAEI